MTVTATIDLPRASWPTVPPLIAARSVTGRVAHSECERAPIWMRATGTTLLVAGLVSTGVVIAWPGSAPEIALVIPALLAVLVGALLVVAETGFDITADGIVLRFRPLPPVRIRRRRIAAVRLVEADAQTYGGLGLRFGRRSRALLLTPGLGLEIADARGRTWFVRTTRPVQAFRSLAAWSADDRPGGPAQVAGERIG